MKKTCFFLLFALLLCLTAVCFSACGSEPDIVSSGDASSLSSESPESTDPGLSSTDPEPSQTSEAEEPYASAVRTFQVADFPEELGLAYEIRLGGEEAKKIRIISNINAETALPALISSDFTREGDLCVVIADGYDESSEETVISCRIYRYLASENNWTLPEEVPELYQFSRDEYLRSGRFEIEYDKDAVSGNPCPYVLLYSENGNSSPKVLYYKEKAVEYPRIVRQCDGYAILSLKHGDDRDYAVINKSGEKIYSFSGETELAECYPLTFFSDHLLCKSDTDDDYEYDRLESIDLKTGTKTVLADFGNRSYWTFSADGSFVAAYESDKDTECCFCAVRSDGTGIAAESGRFTFESDVKECTLFGHFMAAEMSSGETCIFDLDDGSSAGKIPDIASGYPAVYSHRSAVYAFPDRAFYVS